MQWCRPTRRGSTSCTRCCRRPGHGAAESTAAAAAQGRRTGEQLQHRADAQVCSYTTGQTLRWAATSQGRRSGEQLHHRADALVSSYITRQTLRLKLTFPKVKLTLELIYFVLILLLIILNNNYKKYIHNLLFNVLLKWNITLGHTDFLSCVILCGLDSILDAHSKTAIRFSLSRIVLMLKNVMTIFMICIIYIYYN